MCATVASYELTGFGLLLGLAAPRLGCYPCFPLAPLHSLSGQTVFLLVAFLLSVFNPLGVAP